MLHVAGFQMNLCFIEEICSMYLNDWKETEFKGMVGDFEGLYIFEENYERDINKALEKEQWKNLNILLASYTYDYYSGNAFVLFEKEGKLYEVNGGHCSCYGLEARGWDLDGSISQWEPEEISIEALEYRIIFGNLGAGEFQEELKDVLKNLKEV